MHPTCPVGQQFVYQADDQFGIMRCHDGARSSGNGVFYNINYYVFWVAKRNLLWNSFQFGCGRNGVWGTRPSEAYIAEASYVGDSDEWVARELLQRTEQFAMPCSGPPLFPTRSWSVKLSRRSSTWTRVKNYVRTEAKGAGSVTTTTDGKDITDVSGTIVFDHKLKKRSATVVVDLIEPLSKADRLDGDDRYFDAQGRVSFSDLRGCKAGDEVVVELSDRDGAGSPDEVELSPCGVSRPLRLTDTSTPPRRVRVLVEGPQQ